MTKVTSFIHGLYPRSEELVQTSRNFDRKRQTLRELKEQQKKDLENLLKLEKTSKLAFFEDGKLPWQDIFRPLVEASSGMEVGPLTRWFDNNCFFRQPVITGRIQLDEKKLNAFFPKITPAKQWKVTLPSPFMFAKLADSPKEADFEKTLDQITKLLSKVFVYLEEKGVSFIQLNEPYIPYNQSKKSEIKLLINALSVLQKKKGKMTLALHSYFGDSGPLVAAVADSKTADAVGIDFFKTALSTLPKKLPVSVIAGVVEGRNSLLEDKKELQTFTEKAIQYLQPDVLYLTNNSDLQLLPEPVAKEKVKLLGEIAGKFV